MQRIVKGTGSVAGFETGLVSGETQVRTGRQQPLSLLSVAILIWIGSWQGGPQWIKTSSVNRCTWEILVALAVDETQGSQTDTKRLQRLSAFPLGCEDQDITWLRKKSCCPRPRYWSNESWMMAAVGCNLLYYRKCSFVSLMTAN